MVNTYIASDKDLHLLVVEVSGNSLANDVVPEPFYLVNRIHNLYPPETYRLTSTLA
jgi:hypothetical protein